MLLGGKGDSILAALILIFVFLLFSVTTIHFFACKKKCIVDAYRITNHNLKPAALYLLR